MQLLEVSVRLGAWLSGQSVQLLFCGSSFNPHQSPTSSFMCGKCLDRRFRTHLNMFATKRHMYVALPPIAQTTGYCVFMFAFMFHVFFSNVRVCGCPSDQYVSMDRALRSSEPNRLLIYSNCEGIASEKGMKKILLVCVSNCNLQLPYLTTHHSLANSFN